MKIGTGARDEAMRSKDMIIRRRIKGINHHFFVFQR
jgi:hypothetical protein